MKSAMLLTILLPVSALAQDPNFLTPADLPVKARQVFGASGRGQLPEFNREQSIQQALQSNLAAQTCMAHVGRQLTDWVETRRSEGFYWNYEISADFECLAPKVNTSLTAEKAEALNEALRGLVSSGTIRRKTKSALVLCFDRYEQVCEGNRLIRYQNRETCELQDLNEGGRVVTLDDLVDGNNVIRNEGARALNALLPVHRDSRRDDTPGGNCEPHKFNTLKGLSRKSAKVTCVINNVTGETECSVDGIIKE